MKVLVICCVGQWDQLTSPPRLRHCHQHCPWYVPHEYEHYLSLTAEASVRITSRDDVTYTHNLVRNLLCLSLPLLEVWTTTIKLGRVDLFIE